MAFEKNLNGDDLIARISEILDKAEQFGKKRADQVGTEIGKALSDGIQEEMDDAKKDVKNSVGELMAEWQKLVRSINNNKLQMKPEKIKVVLDTAEALKDTERFGKEVRKQLSGIAATFNGVKIKGLDAVAKKFKTSSEELESIDWGFGKHHDTMIQQVTKQADAVKDVGDAAKATQAAVEELTKREKDLANILDKLKEIKDETNAFNDPSIQKTEEKVRKLIGALDEYQTKLDAMKRLRKGNERTMYDTAKSEIADLKRALGAIQAVKDQTPSVKPKIEKKEKEVEQEKPKKTTSQKPNAPVVGAGDSAKSIQEQTMKIEQQASSMKKLGNAAEQTGKQISTVLNKAVKKYNEIMSSIDADSVIGGTGGATIENIGGLKGMLQKAKRIYDMYYESGTTFSDQRNGTQQEKALWKSETAALRGFLTSYSKYVDDSAEAIYAKIQGKKKEFAKYKLPEYSASESQDDEKYLAFKKEELSIYEKQLVVATELFELQRKYNGAKSYTPNWNKELDKDDDEVRALDFTESAVDNYREMAKLAKTSLDRVVEEIETKKARLAKQTAQAQEQETTVIQANTQAVEENIKAKKKQNKIKVRDLTREEYDAAQEKFQQENDGALESLEDTVEIIRQASEFGTSFSTQMETSCKRATTAVQRFFSAIDPNKYPAIASWKDSMLESVRNGYFDDKDMYNGMYTGQYSWGVETIDEDRYYVFLNLLDVAKDKEKEFYAYLNEEYKKRDGGLEKQNELTRRLIQTYKKLDELHVNEPSWDENNEVKSIKRRLEYYEQEKALLQDIQNLKEEFSTIPGRYVNTSDFNEVLRVHRNTLRLGDYGNGNLKDNARAIVLYQAELERAIKRLDKTAALNGQAQEQLKVEQQITAEKQKQIEQQAAANKEVADTSKRVNQAQEKMSIGYHAGDLGKAEWYGNHAYGSRDTGHFGTGTYFVGNPKQIEGYNKRNGVPAPVEQVDFSKYNLFKPETTQQAYDLHRALSLINSDLISLHKYDGLDLPLLKEQLENGDKSGVQGFISKYLDESTRNWYEAQALQYKERLESVTEESIRADVESNYMKSFRDLDFSDDELLLDDDMINEEVERQLMEWRNALANFNLDSRIVQEIIYDIEHEEFDGIQEIQSLKDNISDRLSNIFTNLTKEQIADALEKTYETISQYKQSDFYKLDSASTVFMKNLGYEGIDVRHTELDNTAYGSVIYDLKGRDLERRQEILKLAEAKVPVTPVVEPKAAQNAIEKSTGGTPVEVPVTPVVGEISTTQVPNDIINQLTKGINIEQLLTKYGIPSNKFDIGIDLFKDLAGALYQEDGKAGGEKVNKAFAQLADFIEQNAERTVQVDKTLEEFYNYMSQVQIRIPENMEETFAAENPDNWKRIKKQFAIGGNYQNKKRLITTSKYASTPDVLLEELLANGFGYALGVDKDFNGSAQDSLRIILDAVQRAKDEAKLGKTQKIIGLDMGAQAAMYGDLSEAVSVVEQNYLALNAAASAVNAGNDGVAVSAEKTGETLRNQARDAEDAAKAMESLQNQEQTDEKSVFPAEKVETEIDRIRKAIHSSEIGLDQIANTEGLQAAVATYVKSLDEIDDKKFKLISADINEMAEGVDRVTLKFQSLEDENVKLAQTWAMDDGNLTLGRLRTTKTFVDSESSFDAELERVVANSKVDVLQSQLIGIDHVSQKVTDSLTSLRTAAGNISSDSDIKTFAKNFQVAQNYVKEFKNEYKTLGSLANETQNAQSKMANAQETINAQISSSAKYIGVDGYDKVTQSIDNMTSALSKYNEAQKKIGDGGLDAEAIGKYEKQMADAFTEYNKAEKQLGAAMKEVRANASFDTFSKSMKDAETVIDTAKLKLDKFGDLDGVDKASGYIGNMTEAWKKFNDTDSTIEDKAKAVKDFTSANESFTKQIQYLNEVQKNAPKEESVSNVQTYYEQYVSAIKDLNNVNQQLFAYQGKNESGVYNGLIEQLQQQKIRILAQLQDINSSVEEEVLNIYNPISMDGDKYKFDLSRYLDVNTADTIKEFFNNASVEAELGAESIQKFIDVAMQSQKIDAAFGEGVAKQYKSINDLHESTKEFADTNAEQIFKSIQAGFAAKLTSGTDWTQEQENRLRSLIETYTEYATAIDKAVQKERKILSSVDGKNILQGDQLDPTKDMYDQMVDQAEKMRQATGATAVPIDGFDEATGRLTFTLDGADGKARTFTMSMTELGHVAVAQVKKIDKVKTGWDEFKGSLGGVGKQLLQYGLRMVEIYDIIRYLRQGFNEVLQIDTAMTELKKVTDETAVAYDNFDKSAYASSKKIGSTMKEFIQATADFARLNI